MVPLFPSIITKSMRLRPMSHPASTLLTFLADCVQQKLSLPVRESRNSLSITNDLLLYTKTKYEI